MLKQMREAAEKFDTERASEYEAQSRIALGGYEACHELAACLLMASLGSGTGATILVAGAGGPAREILNAARLEPSWSFVAVDPSSPMLDLARSRVLDAGLNDRVEMVLGVVEDLPLQPLFDAATMIGVLHHLPGDDAKQRLLDAIYRRLKPGAPMILACNHQRYTEQPLFLNAWGLRWRLNGATIEETSAKLGKIVQGADPPESEAAVIGILQAAGFEVPQRFFSSLFWGAWIARRQPETRR
jgi:tRNA (cmo5U34)-methyltransferase